MKVSFNDGNNAFEDFITWALEDKKIFKKIASIIKDIKRDPTSGIGKPEPLKYELSGYWSRRITDEHRLSPNFSGFYVICCPDWNNPVALIIK